MTLTNAVWASQVAAAADLPDKRLDKRLTAIFVEKTEHPSASIPKAAGSPGGAKATYRFYANPRVTADCAATGDCHRNRAAVPGGGRLARGARHDLAELYGAA